MLSKYEISGSDLHIHKVLMPKEASALRVSVVRDKVFMWVSNEFESEKVVRVFKAVTTSNIQSKSKMNSKNYIDSFTLNKSVLHLFELND